jgi:hypothetical protein
VNGASVDTATWTLAAPMLLVLSPMFVRRNKRAAERRDGLASELPGVASREPALCRSAGLPKSVTIDRQLGKARAKNFIVGPDRALTRQRLFFRTRDDPR